MVAPFDKTRKTGSFILPLNPEFKGPEIFWSPALLIVPHPDSTSTLEADVPENSESADQSLAHNRRGKFSISSLLL
jgi:hypothetical protein